MALKIARFVVIVATMMFILVNPSAIYPCGPFFETAEFVPHGEPQVRHEDFAAGDLGIVLPNFRRSYLVVAYRYLNGLKLDRKQQQDAIDVWNRQVGPGPEDDVQKAIGEWWGTRGQVVGVAEGRGPESDASVSREQPYQTFVNCPIDAFRTATATLKERIHKYSATSSAIRDWIAAQDDVFSNCKGEARVIPAVLNSSDPLLRADRDYQIAAAHFYARDFDDAAAAFDAIARDSSSPWASMGSYLAARALIRKANLANPQYGKVDVASMKPAQQRLESILNDPKASAMHDRARKLLDYVRFRTEPDKRVAELEQLMVRPDPGPNFRQHFVDYVLLVSGGEEANDLSDWQKTFSASPMADRWAQAADPGASAQHAVAEWKDKRSLAWLIAALATSGANGPQSAELLKAAAQVPESSPGYLTVRYFALRLMVGEKKEVQARRELDALMGRPTDAFSPGVRNLLNDERQKLATSLPDFLVHAAELPASVGFDYGMEGLERWGDSGKPNPLAEKPYFNSYVAGVLDRRLPLTLLAEFAQSQALPSHLRREIARTAWLRAVLVGDLAMADRLQPTLKEVDGPLWRSMEPFRTATTSADKHFAAVFVSLQNPGLMPNFWEGLLRSSTLGEIDSFRDNWWCGERQEADRAPYLGQNREADGPGPGFLAAADTKRAQQEVEKLKAVGFAPNYLTSEVLAYAKQHPGDPRVPQALYLAVRSTRYGCTDKETTHWSKAAFELLHERYPKSEWAEKTKYYY